MNEFEQAIGRDDRARIVGWLARRFGDLTLAEDATQEACVAAATRWPSDGIPERPAAWLSTTAYRKAIGMLRKQKIVYVPLEETDQTMQRHAASEIDDLFLLILTCCHPALGPEQQVALTLRHVCGLSISQIAAGFVTSEETMAKRLVRARSKMRDAGIAFRTPDADQIDDRIEQVRSIIYLTFTEGYLTNDNDHPIDIDLCDEAIWLAKHLCAINKHDENVGLYALLLTQNARRSARATPTGELVLFADQDRTRWDYEAITEAKQLIEQCTTTVLGRYRVEAAIALLHVSGESPDWPRIADLYSILSRLERSDIIEMNRSIAVAHADGAPAGLAILEPVLTNGRLDSYAKLHITHAELLEKSGNLEAAHRAWNKAVTLTTNPKRREAIQQRADAAKKPWR
jgi:RNA polymerase sigma-70 factor, ECF subfamily